jgi:hypothetical protein
MMTHHGSSARAKNAQARFIPPWLAGVLLTLLALLPAPAIAQEENYAGLIVVFGDGRVEQRCVGFAEASISGYELLRRSGLPLSVEAGAIGPTVCKIGGDGCGFPQEACFCRCMGSPCVYWSYWRLQTDGDWYYQALGAGNTEVRNGDVQGWHWAEGTTNDAQSPPAATFAEICDVTESAVETIPVAPTVTETVTETVTTAVAQVKAVTGTEAGTEAAAAAAAPALAGATGEPTGTAGLWVLLAGVVVVPATVLLVWALVRRGR